MFIFRKKNASFGRMKSPISKKNRNFNYFNKKKNNLRSRIILGSFLIIAFSYFVFFSGFFEIKNIHIENNVNINQEDLKNSFNEILFKKVFGLISLNNFLLIDENNIRAFLLNKYPTIESLEIERKPYNTIIIKVTEKESRIIWCRLENCYYLDKNSVAFANAKTELKLKERPLKIYEQTSIEEEIEDSATETQAKNADKIDIPYSSTNPSAKNETDESIGEQQIAPEIPTKINDRIADADYINFLINIDKQIASKTNLSIKYYKTKGVKTREIIAYTDKNTRLYFDSSEDPSSQVDYLAAFLNNIVSKDKISNLRYVYLKSDNKIFYR